jgi:hypothetical protein
MIGLGANSLALEPVRKLLESFESNVVFSCWFASRGGQLNVDTLGPMLHAAVHGADIQDRDGGVTVMATLFRLYPRLGFIRVWALSVLTQALR